MSRMSSNRSVSGWHLLDRKLSAVAGVSVVDEVPANAVS